MGPQSCIVFCAIIVSILHLATNASFAQQQKAIFVKEQIVVLAKLPDPQSEALGGPAQTQILEPGAFLKVRREPDPQVSCADSPYDPGCYYEAVKIWNGFDRDARRDVCFLKSGDELGSKIVVVDVDPETTFGAPLVPVARADRRDIDETAFANALASAQNRVLEQYETAIGKIASDTRDGGPLAAAGGSEPHRLLRVTPGSIALETWPDYSVTIRIDSDCPEFPCFRFPRFTRYLFFRLIDEAFKTAKNEDYDFDPMKATVRIVLHRGETAMEQNRNAINAYVSLTHENWSKLTGNGTITGLERGKYVSYTDFWRFADKGPPQAWAFAPQGGDRTR